MNNHRTRPKDKNTLAETRHQYSTAFRDFAVISGTAIFVYVVSFVFNLHALLDNWLNQYKVARFDQLLSVMPILAGAFAIFAVRRWRELKTEMAERKQAEDELKQQKERLQKIVDNIPVMIVFISPDGKTEWVNGEWQRVLGWTLQETQSKDILVEMYPDPDDQQEVLDFALHPPPGWCDFRTRVKDGRIVDTAWANVLLSDGSSIGIGQDISERKQAEEEIKRQATRAETLARIAARLNKQLELDVVIHAVCEEALDTFNVSQTAMSLHDQKSDLLVYAGGINIPPEYVATMEPMNRARFEEFVQTMGPTFVIPNVQTLQGVPNVEFNARQDIRTVVITTMVRGQELIGTLTLGVIGHVRKFNEDELALLKAISDQAVQAIANAQLFEQVRSAHERLHRLSRQLLEVQETERRYVALELHDQIGQNLTAIKLNLQAAQRTTQASPLMSILEQGLATVERALQRVRNLSLDLRPSMLDDLGLVATLRWYVDRLARQTDLTIAFTAEGLETRPAPFLETTCFRVAQEALTNVIRHAQARQVQIELWQQEGGLNLLIRDDGRGFDAAAALKEGMRGNSIGLLGMQERINLAGGRLEIESAHGYGTEIRACFPLTNTGRNNQ